MKKIIAFSMLMLSAITYTNAQKITYDPPVPDPDLPMTVTIDLEACTNQTLAGLPTTPDIYIWTWVSGVGDSPTNGTWGTSDERNKMTKVGTTGKKYSFTYSPTLKAHFQKDAQDLWGKTFGCLAKAKDGGGTPENKTENQEIKIPTPVTGRQLQATHPLKSPDTVFVDRSDIVTFIYNNSLDTLAWMQDPSGTMLKDSFAVFPTVFFSDGTFRNHTNAGVTAPTTYDYNPALQLKAVGDKEYRLSFIPNQFFTEAEGCVNWAAIKAKLDAGLWITKIKFQVVKKRPQGGAVRFGPAAYEFFLPKP
jgi:hypothetical protein